MRHHRHQCIANYPPNHPVTRNVGDERVSRKALRSTSQASPVMAFGDVSALGGFTLRVDQFVRPQALRNLTGKPHFALPGCY